MKSFIILRQSPNWGEISESDFREQSRQFCQLMGRPPEQVNMSVDLWNRTFSTSFCTVRQEIKNITIENLKNINNTELLFGKQNTLPTDLTGSFYILIDDDDWLSPDIATQLHQTTLAPHQNGVIWQSAAFGTRRAGIITRRPIDGYCYTNNYAIHGEAFRKSTNKYWKFFQHGGANDFLKQPQSITASACWSITNKHPASTVYMEQVLQGRFDTPSLLIDSIDEYLHRCTNLSHELDPDIEWAHPLMDKTISIFSKLLHTKRV